MMETYVIDKQFIKVYSIVHHFDCITWTLKARAQGKHHLDAYERVHINQGIYYCSDGARLHVYSPDYEELPESFNIPDGEYTLVAANKKQIVLRFFSSGEFTWGEILKYKRIGEVPKFTLDSERILSVSLFNWHIAKHTKQCFNMDYIRDAAFTGDITFERTGKKWMSPIVFGTPERFAMIAPLKLPEED